MPWKIKREIYLILLGCAVIVLGSIVLALNTKHLSIELLAVVAILGGFAIILNTLPTNGHNGGDKENGGSENGRRKTGD